MLVLDMLDCFLSSTRHIGNVGHEAIARGQRSTSVAICHARTSMYSDPRTSY
jgi:hypothetical protein